MPTISTHVLDGASGGPVGGVRVEVADAAGTVVGVATTDQRGRAEDLATRLPPGRDRVTWRLGGFVSELAATVTLEEDRNYHLPVLASGHSAVVYLGV